MVTSLFMLQDMANGTPSRLQNTSVAAAPRVALHSLEETLAGKLLASVPAGTCMGPKDAMNAVSEAVSELDSVAASDFVVPASQVFPTLPRNKHEWVRRFASHNFLDKACRLQWTFV